MPKQDEAKVNQGAGGNSLSRFEQLSTALHQQFIAQYLSKEDLLALSQVSRAIFFTYCDPLAKTLLSHVVKGEEAEALKMIDANPKLLLTPSRATDYSGRYYQKVTPFQAALLCHDVTLWKKIEPYFDKLPNGQEEKVSQFKAIFPEGAPKQKAYDFTSLIQVISKSSDADIMATLRKENNDTPICQALKSFRETFKDLAIKEAFFNPLHLIEAFKVYDAQFDHWTRNQRDLFWRQVIGYTQRFLPASYAQAFCQGLYFIVEEKNPLRRSLKFQYDDGSYFPSLDSGGLGFDFGISRGRCAGVRHLLGRRPANYLRSYVEQIQQRYLDLSIACGMMDNPSRAATDLSSWSWCAIF